MSKVTQINHPLILHKLAFIRSKDTGSKYFRELVEEVSMLMAYEATRKLYKKFGFEEGELIEEFGYPNQRFVLHADKSADNVIIGTKVTVTVDRPLGRTVRKNKDFFM